MPFKPIRKAARRWQARLKKMYGQSVRPKMVVEEPPSFFGPEKKQWLPSYVNAQVFYPKNKKGPLIAISSQTEQEKVSPKKAYRSILAHELGHIISTTHSNPAAKFAHRIIAVISEMEYCKRFSPERYREFMQWGISSSHYEIDFIVRQIMQRFPHAKERNLFVRFLLKELSHPSAETVKEMDYEGGGKKMDSHLEKEVAALVARFQSISGKKKKT